jgi:hypothetical protein
MYIKISKLQDELEQMDYHNLLLSQNSSLLYHGLHYHQLLQVHLGCDAYYIIVYNEHKILAALPFLIKKI